MASPIALCDTAGMTNERWLECRAHGRHPLEARPGLARAHLSDERSRVSDRGAAEEM